MNATFCQILQKLGKVEIFADDFLDQNNIQDLCPIPRRVLLGVIPGHVFIDNSDFGLTTEDVFGHHSDSCGCLHSSWLDLSKIINRLQGGAKMPITDINQLNDRQRATLDANTQIFIEADVLDDDLSLTSRGKNELLEFLFDKNKTAFAKYVAQQVEQVKSSEKTEE